MLALRSEVFVVEQACAYQDIDGLDLVDGTVHVVGRVTGQGESIAAYARILAPGEARPTPRIGRVIVAQPGAGATARATTDAPRPGLLRGALARSHG